jgi:molecular chaperone HscB
VPQDFLMQQMEWREELETHKQNKEALEKLASDIQKNKDEIMSQLPEFFKNKNNLHDAIKITRELNFIEKIEQHINDALIEII